METKRNEPQLKYGTPVNGGWKSISEPVNPAQIDITPESADTVPALVPGLEIELEVEVQPEMPEECGYCITPAMSYMPMQKWNTTFEPEMGFQRGTIFPELDLPFLGEGGKP